ncbi:hypothetical protein [Corallococcus sp. RDP092CA]|uniref:hypothetical protein n=1 Tax=Corallococcus sp. RDP092CA TaxID=3109369 RepID=UPI0035B38608
MKKLIALFGLVAGLAATSYSVPAIAAADRGSTYTGPTSQLASDVIIIIIDENEYYWVEYYSNATANTSNAAPALNDAAFDR